MTARTDPWLDADVDRLSIFVPAIMSAGLVFSIVTLIHDVVHERRRHHHHDRRVQIAATVTAAHVTTGEPPERVLGRVIRPRRAYVLTSITCLAAAAYIVIGASANYRAGGGYVHDIAWILAVSIITGVLLVWLGVGAGLLIAPGRRPSAFTTELLLSTPLGVAPDTDDPSSSRRYVLGWATLVTLGAFGVVALGVGAARGSFHAADERILDVVAGWHWLGALEAADLLGRTDFAVLAALVVGVATLRCLPFAAAYVTSVIVSLGATTLLRLVVERQRPPGTSLTGAEDSFPSGHVVQAVVIAGLLPLAIQTLSRRRAPATVAAVLLGAAALLTGLLRIHLGFHWPTDVLGGATLGAAVVLGVRWSLEFPSWHARCHGCPWSTGTPPAKTAVALSPPARHRVQRASQLLALGGLVLFGALAATVGIPRNPEGTSMGAIVEVGGTMVCLAIIALAWLASLRWPVAGAVGLAAGGLLLGLLSSVAYHPVVSLIVAAVFVVPAIGLWLVWQHGRTRRVMRVLAVVCASSTVALYGTATAVHERFFGPSHPVSDTPALPIEHVEWAWSGHLLPGGFEVVAGVRDGAEEAALLVRRPGASDLRTNPVPVTDEGVVRLQATGLLPGESYEYAVVVDGEVDHSRGRGRSRTAPIGPTDLRFAVSSCAQTGSNGQVFDAIRHADPDLYLITGDIHYGNPSESDEGLYRSLLERTLKAPAQAALYREVPVAYVWDDHDYGPNDADSSSPSRQAAWAAYRQLVPSATAATGPINQAFSLGRVRVVVTDTRSARDDRTMLGDDQLRWLLDELTTSAPTHALVLWVNSVPWIAPDDPLRDDWAGWADERRTITDAIQRAGIHNLVMVSGDAHMVALDDGTNSGGFPVLHAGALDRPGSVKGGPYSDGAFPGAGQFGLVDIEDDGGDRIVVTLSGRTWEDEILVQRSFSIDVPPGA